MKTKNLFRVSMAALCAIMMTGLMTSCDKNNQNNPDEPQPQVGKAVAARTASTVILSDDIVELMDITIDYYNNAGELKQMVLTTPELELTTKASLPTKAGMCLRLQIKEGVNLEEIALVDLSNTFGFRCAAVDENDKIVGDEHKLDDFGTTTKLAGSKVQAWVEAFNANHQISFLYEFDAEGNSQSASWDIR